MKRLILLCLLCVFTACSGGGGSGDTGYNVDFDTDGGTAVAALNDVTEIVTEPVTTRAGYSFEGWFDNELLDGSRLTFPYTVTQDIRLFAKWTPLITPAFDVEFDTDGGSAVTTMYSVTEIAVKPVTTKTGYVLLGWYDALDNEISFPYTVTQNTTLYAKWAVIPTFDVIFYTDGGTAVAALNDVTEIATEPVTTRSGYSFEGWFDNELLDGSRLTFPYTVEQDITLYAKWTAIDAPKYNVDFDTDGGTAVAALNDVTEIAIEPVSTRAGYVLLGWYDASDNKISFPYTVTESITLYAKWQSNVEAILEVFPEITVGTEISSTYEEETGWGWGPYGTAKIVKRQITGLTDADMDAFEASLEADGFVDFHPWEKVTDGMRYIVSYTYSKDPNVGLMIDTIVVEDVPDPSIAPRAILVTPSPVLANSEVTEEITEAVPPYILQGRRVSVLETDSIDGPETMYTVNYNPTGSNATCTDVESDDLAATVALEAGITTWATRITKLRYSTVHINYDQIYPAYMICKGVRVPVRFLGKTE